MGVSIVDPHTENLQHQSDTETSSVGPEIVVETGAAGPRLTEQTLNKILRGDPRNYYLTKELNDKLFIHYGGYRRLENLEGFTGLKVLYGECNSFARLEGLGNCGNLRSLFLNQNCIRRIENLEHNTDLWSVNLADNFIDTIDNIKHLTKLNTLIISNNNIGLNGVGDLLGLVDTPISVLDIQSNKIEDANVVTEIFMKMPNLAVLYLKNNPVVKLIPNYRKSLIVRLPNLKYLDDRPVFEDERRLAEAYVSGGVDAERTERRLIQQEKENEYRRNSAAFEALVDDAKAAHREQQAMRSLDRYGCVNSDPVDTLEKKQRKWYQLNSLDIAEGVALPTVPAGLQEPELIAASTEAQQHSKSAILWDEPIFETSEADNTQAQVYDFDPPARQGPDVGRRMEIVEDLPPLEPVTFDEMD